MTLNRNSETYRRLDHRADQFLHRESQRINKRPFSRTDLINFLQNWLPENLPPNKTAEVKWTYWYRTWVDQYSIYETQAIREAENGRWNFAPLSEPDSDPFDFIDWKKI